MNKPIKPIFEYVDYRLFLKEYYAFYKEHEKGFSHRKMAADLGFTSPNFLKMVMDGNRSLSLKSIKKITGQLGFNKGESTYFGHLVFFTQAKDSFEKSYYFGMLSAMRTKRNIKTLTADKFEYFSNWYVPVVRELVVGRVHPLNYNELSAQVNGVVSNVKIKQAVATLVRLQMITINKEGVYTQTQALINTNNELDSFAIRQYHEQVLGIAQKSLHTIAPPKREYGSLTLRISKEGFNRIKNRLQDMRQELLQLAGDDADPQGIYHINYQMYPVTAIKETENETR